ncbi:hypothetical protein F5141DRAFT_1065919 [Pisolithus sp. B1]|nr:hypothetical protein F5141DRAFT_1065919 [Pisolithus sp. B1]
MCGSGDLLRMGSSCCHLVQVVACSMFNVGLAWAFKTDILVNKWNSTHTTPQCKLDHQGIVIELCGTMSLVMCLPLSVTLVTPMSTISSSPDPTGTQGTDVAPLPTNPLLLTSKGKPSKHPIVHDIAFLFDRGSKDTKCKFCLQSYKSTTGHGSLCWHIQAEHLGEYIEQIEKGNQGKVYISLVHEAVEKGYTIPEIKVHFMAGNNLATLPGHSVESNITTTNSGGWDGIPSFSMERFGQYLAVFTVSDDQLARLLRLPYRLLLLQESFMDLDIPCPMQTHDIIIHLWYESFIQLQSNMRAGIGNISFTMDVWLDKAGVPYLAMTGHWINKDPVRKVLHLECGLLAFHWLRQHHISQPLAQSILYLLDRMGITDKNLITLSISALWDYHTSLIKIGNEEGWHKYPPVMQVPSTEPMLEVIYMMSAESQLQLSTASQKFELFITSWEKLASHIPHLKPCTDHALSCVYEHYMCNHNKDAYVLAMLLLLKNYQIKCYHEMKKKSWDPASTVTLCKAVMNKKFSDQIGSKEAPQLWIETRRARPGLSSTIYDNGEFHQHQPNFSNEYEDSWPVMAYLELYLLHGIQNVAYLKHHFRHKGESSNRQKTPGPHSNKIAKAPGLTMSLSSFVVVLVSTDPVPNFLSSATPNLADFHPYFIALGLINDKTLKNFFSWMANAQECIMRQELGHVLNPLQLYSLFIAMHERRELLHRSLHLGLRTLGFNSSGAQSMQTVKEEFYSYVSNPREPPMADPLVYWGDDPDAHPLSVGMYQMDIAQVESIIEEEEVVTPVKVTVY